MIEFQSYIDKINELIAADDLVVLGKEVSELRSHFDDYLLEQERLHQIAKIEAKEGGNEIEEVDFESVKEAFYSVFKKFQEIRKQQVALRNALEAENLKLKKSLMDRLKEVIASEENISAAYNAYKEIHETWKKVGDLPREKRDEIQREYSRILEIFFYTMKIYRDIKDHDYKRNAQLKQGVIHRLQKLRNSNELVRNLEMSLRVLQDEWEEIGPVANDEWEVVKNSYWEAVRSIYDKINAHYEGQRTLLNENISKKKVIIESLKVILTQIEDNESPKFWEGKTAEVLKLQEEWKKIGAGSKKENDAVWTTFRELCNTFFGAKKALSKKIDGHIQENIALKKGLIDEVKAIHQEIDWKLTADKIIKIQQRWKSIGSAGQKFENRLWSEFRSACDVFFQAREQFTKDQADELTKNLELKEALITAINNYQIKDKSTALVDFKIFSQSFNDIGHVPLNKKEVVFNDYKKALDAKYNELKLEGSEKASLLFSAKLDVMKANPERSKLYQKERADIKRQMDTLNQEALQYETNLGFFAKSKGADILKKEVEGKIEKIKQEILQLRGKLKLIPNE
ncbi:MAG: DUF349 domain-containing protein [Flavobacteriia bacterium]|nr:DUF349 domain-containing protein [Flavobacteriia bacterium]